jgi:hypothetical protein
MPFHCPDLLSNFEQYGCFIRRIGMPRCPTANRNRAVILGSFVRGCLRGIIRRIFKSALFDGLKFCSKIREPLTACGAQLFRSHTIYLEANSGYFGHQYQPFRCLRHRENHRIVVRKRTPYCAIQRYNRTQVDGFHPNSVLNQQHQRPSGGYRAIAAHDHSRQ